MAIRQGEEDLVRKVIESHPELVEDCIHPLLKTDDGTYIGGMGFFGKIDKEGKLINIISEDTKLDGSDKSLFGILFDGNIYGAEESSEYKGMLTFDSNAAGYLNVFYNPKENEFYMAPCAIRKAYKAVGDNRFKEAELPEFSKHDAESFQWWLDYFKALSDEKIISKQNPSK